MIKISKQKFLTTTILLAVLMISSSMALSPTAHAQAIGQKITDSQNATAFLSSVVGLNMNAYTTSLTSKSITATPVSNLLQDNMIFSLTSAQSSLRATCTFINGDFNMLYLSDYVGSPSLTQPTTNAIANAQGFMQRYQSYTGNPFYGSLGSMLDNVALNTNTTQTAGNVQLQASVFGSSEQDLVWTYVDNNGVPAPMKDVVLTYINGQLESFLDNWQLYQIAGVPTVSSQEAVAAALQAANNFSYTSTDANGVIVTVSGFQVAAVFNVSLSYLNYFDQTPEQSVRSGDHVSAVSVLVCRCRL